MLTNCNPTSPSPLHIYQNSDTKQKYLEEKQDQTELEMSTSQREFPDDDNDIDDEEKASKVLKRERGGR